MKQHVSCYDDLGNEQPKPKVQATTINYDLFSTIVNETQPVKL